MAHHQPKSEDPVVLRNQELFFNSIKDVLPCKQCRASTTEFMETELPLHPRVRETARWLYELHNRVNKKLREQSKTDPQVRDPGPDPSFEVIRDKQTRLLSYPPEKVKVVPGADFMTALAQNQPDKPTSDQVEAHYIFWSQLLTLFPQEHQRKRMETQVSKHLMQPAFQNRSAYKKWVHGLLKALCRDPRSYRGMCQQVGQYKSACNSPTQRGKTCRRGKDGKSQVKNRDHDRTYRRTHARLLA